MRSHSPAATPRSISQASSHPLTAVHPTPDHLQPHPPTSPPNHTDKKNGVPSTDASPKSTIQPSEVPLNSTYPLLDSDPHFTRVVKYFRGSDYATWLGFTAAVPGLMYAWDLSDPIKVNHPKTLKRVYGMSTWLGFCGGFLFAYQQSSLRFWGWRENEREAKMQEEEFTALARAGKPIWGESDLAPWLQTSAWRNSQYSQVKLAAVPWFNFVNHPYHGVDVSKYYDAAKAEKQES